MDEKDEDGARGATKMLLIRIRKRFAFMDFVIKYACALFVF